MSRTGRFTGRREVRHIATFHAQDAAGEDYEIDQYQIYVESLTPQGVKWVADVQRLFDTAVDTFGGVDVAVNTTGMVLRKPILDTSEEEFDRMFAINAKAGYFFIQESGRRLNDGGKIISLGTSLLAAFTDGYSTYAGGKAPLEHFTRAAAKEFADRGISVNVVAPGPMDTPFFYPAETPETVAYHKFQSMNGDLTKIEDIVPIVGFLATDGWWITGQTIFVNGG